jgi:hypothetical protein
VSRGPGAAAAAAAPGAGPPGAGAALTRQRLVTPCRKRQSAYFAARRPRRPGPAGTRGRTLRPQAVGRTTCQWPKAALAAAAAADSDSDRDCHGGRCGRSQRPCPAPAVRLGGYQITRARRFTREFTETARAAPLPTQKPKFSAACNLTRLTPRPTRTESVGAAPRTVPPATGAVPARSLSE